jgi:glutaconyl-CoA/methylmalonyl-CoA decarboxylase subunit gamma
MKLSVKIDNQSFEVEVGNLQFRPIQVTVDGEAFEVWVEENGVPQALPAVSQPLIPAVPLVIEGATAQTGDRTKVVLAPIPGVIVSVGVKVGDNVVFGQELCVLEAMKMKNLIKANRSGKIAAIFIASGDQVRHNQALMEYCD